MMKKCSKCKEDKLFIAFNKNKSKSDGYSTECKNCVNNYNNKYRAEHKNEAAAYNKVYRQENKEAISMQKKQYSQEHKIESTIRAHKWYEKNKELTKERTRIAKQQNRERYKNYAYKRRAQKKTTIIEDFSIQDIINIYGNTCYYCCGEFEHIDHYVPLSKGGTHTLNNIRPSCKKCNLIKNNKTPDEWLEFMKIKKIGEKI